MLSQVCLEKEAGGTYGNDVGASPEGAEIQSLSKMYNNNFLASVGHFCVFWHPNLCVLFT